MTEPRATTAGQFSRASPIEGIPPGSAGVPPIRANLSLRNGALASSPAGLAASAPPFLPGFGRRDGVQPAGGTPALPKLARMGGTRALPGRPSHRIGPMPLPNFLIIGAAKA